MSDAYNSAPSKPPVQCLKCQGTGVILSQARDAIRDELRWRYRCLDCAIAWWVDEHGGDYEEYMPREG